MDAQLGQGVHRLRHALAHGPDLIKAGDDDGDGHRAWFLDDFWRPLPLGHLDRERLDSFADAWLCPWVPTRREPQEVVPIGQGSTWVVSLAESGCSIRERDG